jgi:hypothetical protein
MRYFVYKYTYNNEIIYIGKTDDIDRRIREHASGQGLEEKFLPYLDSVEIHYHECCNEVEMSALERLLINQYKPVLNVVDIVAGDATVFIELSWARYTAATDDRRSGIEHAIMLCQKNISANETRIQAYIQEDADLRDTMNRTLPFYNYLRKHYQSIVSKPNEYYGLTSADIPPCDTVSIGLVTVDKWYDDMSTSGDIIWVQFSAELLQALFMVAHNDNWVDQTLLYIGLERCQVISKKVANLRRINAELMRERDVLREQLEETPC